MSRVVRVVALARTAGARVMGGRPARRSSYGTIEVPAITTSTTANTFSPAVTEGSEPRARIAYTSAPTITTPHSASCARSSRPFAARPPDTWP